MLSPFRKKTAKPDTITFLNPKDVKLHTDFKSLFPVNTTVRDSIAKSMRKDGFNQEFPLIIWKEKECLIDGHTRLSAAKQISLKQVPVIYKSFPSQQAATDYALTLQFNRRNLTDADLFAFINTLDTENLPGTGRKQERLAKVCSISTTKAMRFLKVKRDASPHHISQILDGSLSVNTVYNKITGKRNQLNSKAPKKPKSSGKITVDEKLLHKKLAEWRKEVEEGILSDSIYSIKLETLREILPISSSLTDTFL